MRRFAIIVAVAAFLIAAPAADSPGALRQTAIAEELAIIVNRSNPVDNLSLSELRRIYMIETPSWGNGRKITVMLREKGPARSIALALICGMSEEQYDRHILFQTFRGTINQGPRDILSDSAMIRFVFNAPGAIGYVPAEAADSSTKVLHIDGMLPGNAKYPLRRLSHAPAGGDD